MMGIELLSLKQTNKQKRPISVFKEKSETNADFN